MSLQRFAQKFTLLSRNHQCNRHFVRLRRKISPEVLDKHLDPEVNPSLCSKMTMVSQQQGDHIYITGYSHLGFSLHNNIRLAGPTVFFPRNCLKWKIFSTADINEKSLGLFSLLSPKLDLLIIGTGNTRKELQKETIKFLRKHHIIFEVMSTHQAIAAFNFQNNDQRWVAAAILPPEGAKDNLTKYVQNVYKTILDKTDLIYKEEEELPKIESSVDEGTKKLKDTSQEKDQLKISDKEKIGIDDQESDVQFTTSPLGQSLDFMSSASVKIEHSRQRDETETLKEKNSSEENKPEEKKS